MLAPLTRITDATRMAATGSLPHRSNWEGPNDEFRALADALNAMLAQLERTLLNSRDSRPMPRTNHGRHWPSRRHCSTWPVKTRTATPTNSSTAFRAVNTRAIDLTEALLQLSRADQRSAARSFRLRGWRRQAISRALSIGVEAKPDSTGCGQATGPRMISISATSLVDTTPVESFRNVVS
jgi:hypothetical protein